MLLNSAEISTGQKTIATSGTPLPLLGVTYSTGTVTLVSGSNMVTGATTEWAANLPTPHEIDYKIKTAGGKFYRVKEVHSDTSLEIYGTATASETTAAYQAYKTPHTDRILIKGITASEEVYVCANSGDKDSGHEVAAQGTVELLVDLHFADIWIDASADTTKYSYLLETGG